MIASVLIAAVFALVQLPAMPGRPMPGQVPGTGPRDRAVAQTGTGRLAGVVLAADGSRPLRRAQVRLFGPELRDGRMTTTDGEGRWELRDLPAGRYTLSAGKAGYVTLEHGQRRPGDRGKQIELADGQSIASLTFTLPRGSVISGRITDEFGEPVADAMVLVQRFRYFNGRRQLVPAGRPSSTDDLGHFRVYGLPPGSYYVTATLRSMSGPFVDSDERVGHAPTYYPGTANVAEAQPVTVAAGAEQSNLAIALQPVRTVRVSGSVVDSEGRPLAEGFVVLLPAAGEGTMARFNVGSNGRLRPDGTFTISGVAPGDYSLHVMTPRAGDQGEAAHVAVTVGAEDLSGVTVATSAGSLLSGQIVFEQSPGDGVRPSMVQLFAQPKDPAGFQMGGAGPPKMNDDWTFELRAHVSPILLRAAAMPPGFRLKGVFMDGVDATDTGLSFRSGESIGGIQVVLTNRQIEVSGTVTDSRGQVLKDYVVLVFSEDDERWGFMSRHRGQGRPDQQGRFKLTTLPAGSYLAAALASIEDGADEDPEFLERLRSLATPFTLQDGETRALTLRLVEAP